MCHVTTSCHITLILFVEAASRLPRSCFCIFEVIAELVNLSHGWIGKVFVHFVIRLFTVPWKACRFIIMLSKLEYVHV